MSEQAIIDAVRRRSAPQMHRHRAQRTGSGELARCECGKDEGYEKKRHQHMDKDQVGWVMAALYAQLLGGVAYEIGRGVVKAQRAEVTRKPRSKRSPVAKHG